MTKKAKKGGSYWLPPNSKLVLIKTAELARRRVFATEPPYSPWSVADWLGVRVEERDLSGIDGYMTLQEGEDPLIVLARNAPSERKRFTLAHELGHVVLLKGCRGDGRHVGNLQRFRTKDVSSAFLEDPIEERLCNFFAAELLMPLSDVKDLLGEREIEPETVLAIARVFKVSLAAAARRARDVRWRSVSAISLWSRKPWLVPIWTTGRMPGSLPDTLELALARQDGECFVEELHRSLRVGILTLPRADKVLTVATQRGTAGRAGQLLLPL